MTLRGLAAVRDHITEMCLHKYRGSYQGEVQNCSKLNGIGLFSRQVKFAECTITFSYWNVRTSSAFCKRWFASCNWRSNIPHVDTPNSEHTLLRTVLGYLADMCVHLCQDMYVHLCQDMCVHLCQDMCVHLCQDMCVHLCQDMCLHLCQDMSPPVSGYVSTCIRIFIYVKSSDVSLVCDSILNICVCVCVYVWVGVCVYVCVCVSVGVGVCV
jgi:hypothetical protein